MKLYIEHLRGLLLDAHESLKDYKRQIETYRAEIEQMRHALETLNSNNMSHLVPRLQLVSETYNSGITQQRKENLHLQQRLTDLKKDKSLMQQQIARYSTQIQQMERAIGL